MTVLAVLGSILPSFRLSYNIQDKEAGFGGFGGGFGRDGYPPYYPLNSTPLFRQLDNSELIAWNESMAATCA